MVRSGLWREKGSLFCVTFSVFHQIVTDPDNVPFIEAGFVVERLIWLPISTNRILKTNQKES